MDTEALERRADRLRGDGDPGELCRALIELAASWFYRDLGRAMEVAGEAASLAEEHGLPNESARSVRQVGTIHWASGRYDLAMEHLEEAAARYRGLEDEKGLAACINNIGLVQDSRGELEEALKSHFQALRIRERLGDERDVFLSLTNIGNVCNRIEHFSEAMRFHGRAMEMAERLGDDAALAGALVNTASAHSGLGESGRSLELQLTALAVYERMDNPEGVSIVCTNAGISLSRLERVEEALEMLDRALSICRSRGDEVGIARTLLNIAGIHLDKLGAPDRALSLLEEGLGVARDTGDHQVLMKYLEVLSQTMEATGDMEAALRFHREHSELRRAIINGDVFTTLSSFERQRLEERVEESRRREEELRRKQEDYRALSLTDPLTGLRNRRYFYGRAPLVLEAASGTGEEVSAAMMDVDLFKEVNDRLGHHEGDLVLRRVASVLSEGVRPDDLLARIGGDEFALLLRRCPERTAAELMRDMAGRIATEEVGVTVSCGVAGLAPGGGDSLEALLQRADRALYRAKRAGRGSIIADGSPE